jgi:hypothetical protein
VQDGEEADFSSEVPGVGGNLEHGLSGGAEEKIVKQPRVPLTQRVQLVGQGKNNVEVRYAEQVLFASCEPTVACLRLAFGTVSVATGVIGDGLMVTT